MWTMKLEGVPRAVNCQAVTINSKIYSFGIRRKKGDLIDACIFCPKSNRWDVEKTQPLPGDGPIFYDFTVVAYGNCAYVCGGWAGQKSDSGGTLYRFDTSTLTWSCPKVSGDEPRTLCYAACVVGNCMYLICDKREGDLPHIHFLQFDTYRWNRVHTSGDAPTCPLLSSACTIESRIYVWGSRAHDNSVFSLDTVTSTWVRPHVEGVAPECRLNHTVFVYKGEMYIFGGYNRQQSILFADVHKYDPEKSCWTQVRPKRSGPCARLLHACCVIEDRAFVIGGRRSNPASGEQSTRTYRELVSPYHVDEEVLTNLYVLDFAPTLQTLCAAIAADARVVIGDKPEKIINLISAMKC